MAEAGCQLEIVPGSAHGGGNPHIADADLQRLFYRNTICDPLSHSIFADMFGKDLL